MLDICSIGHNFWATWAVLSLLGLISILGTSSVVFYYYYVKATLETWQNKIHPEYPSAKKVRDEIVLMLKGLVFSSLCPTLSLYLSSHGHSQAYCTFSNHDHGFGFREHVIQFVFITLASDFYEWFYHRLGHVYKPLWEVHRHHHIFYNPSPFSVISDEAVDQVARALPLVIFPAIMPINMELMFFIYAVFFYVYGVYLHWGHELPGLLSAHHPIFNTSYQHYIHHAKSIYGKPYHTGFFFKIWDQMMGSVYPADKCDCLICQRRQGLVRTRQQFEALARPDYSVLWKDATIWFSHPVQYDNPSVSPAAEDVAKSHPQG